MTKKVPFYVSYLFFFIGLVSYSQISKPTFLFSKTCGSSTFNTFSVTYNFSGTPAPTNQFSIELSNDNFVTFTVVGISTAGTINTSPSTQSFMLPTNVFGENYRVRVRGSAPAQVSIGSDAFPAYYIKHNQRIILNTESASNNITACGNNYTLSITSTGTPSSPLFYPELIYKWYKVNAPSPDILVATGNFSNPSYTVTSAGKYYVETDYGSCSVNSNSISSQVTVNFITGTNLTISSSNGTTLCQGNTTTLTGSIANNPSYTFKWFKDGTLISGATTNTYLANAVGTYTHTVDTGACLINATITLAPSVISATLNLPSPSNINPGQTVALIATTSANAPTFDWYLNNVLQTGAVSTSTNSTFLATQPGVYKVIITQTVGCITTKELTIILLSNGNSNPPTNDIPNLITPDNDGVNDTWVLPNSILSQADVKVEILNDYGKSIFLSTNYNNNWPDSDVEIPKTNPIFYFIISIKDQLYKQGSLTVVK